MTAIFHALYGLLAYLFFLASFLYAIAFVLNVPGLKTLDHGPAAPLGHALAVNLLLLSLFAMQHSVMARPAFKRWWTRIVPHALERSTYVLMASATLALLFWQWRPIAGSVWSLSGTTAGAVLQVVGWAGWGVVLVSTFLINHFELFGLRQSFARLLRLGEPGATFRTPGFYRWVRHPIYLGFILAFWGTADMSAGHLLFAAMTSAYILVGIFFEERDLVDQFGAQYVAYRRRVGMLLPRVRRGSPAESVETRSSSL